jgi:hypothetical protein
MPKPTSAAEQDARARRHRHAGQPPGQRLSSARGRMLEKEIPGLKLSLHAAAEWEACAAGCSAAMKAPTARSASAARRPAPVRAASLPRDIAKATSSSPACCSWKTTSRPCCRRCRPAATLRRHGRLHVRRRGHAPDAHGQVRHGRPAERADGAAEEAARRAQAREDGKNEQQRRQQMAMLRRIPKLLRFIPGTAQDVRAYFLLLQYWLAGSDRTSPTWCASWSTAMPTVRGGAARQAQGRGAGGVPGGRRLPSAHEGRDQPSKVAKLPKRKKVPSRHRRPAGDALLRAGRQHRPLRRRHQGAGGRGLR